jgi:hypothetical protein
MAGQLLFSCLSREKKCSTTAPLAGRCCQNFFDFLGELQPTCDCAGTLCMSCCNPASSIIHVLVNKALHQLLLCCVAETPKQDIFRLLL